MFRCKTCRKKVFAPAKALCPDCANAIKRRHEEVVDKYSASVEKYARVVDQLVDVEVFRAEFKAQLTAMHRRCQRAEAGVPAWEQIKAKSNGTVKGFGRALLVATIQKQERQLAEIKAERDALLKLTESLDEHPDDYDGPCWCKTCQSYAADDHDPNS